MYASTVDDAIPAPKIVSPQVQNILNKLDIYCQNILVKTNFGHYFIVIFL